MSSLLDELRRRALEAGGPEKVRRQRERGKLLARERVELFFDKNSFEEIGWLVGESLEGPLGDGVIAGYGRINGRLVFGFFQDFTIMGGSIGLKHAKKIAWCIRKAMEVGVPVIGVFDSGGARIQEGVNALHGVGLIFASIIEASGIIPQVAVMAGPCAGGAAYAPALMDFVVMVDKISYMFITGPNVVKEVTGEDVTFQDLGGASVHSRISGVAHFRAQSEEDAARIVKKLLSYLPDNCKAMPPRTKPLTNPEEPVYELESILPEDRTAPYDMRELLKLVVDPGSLFGVHEEWAPNIITAFGRIGGVPVCIIANQPKYKAGVIDIDASCKAARFIRFCDCFNLPILMFVDVPGYMPGVDQEHGGIIRHGAKMLYAYYEATVPKITVIIRKAYGGAYISMGSKALGADVVYAWPTAEIAVLGPEAAVRILYRKELEKSENPDEVLKKLAAEYAAKHLNPFNAALQGYIDDVIKPSETRRKIYRALMMLLPKKVNRTPRKHGNIPL